MFCGLMQALEGMAHADDESNVIAPAVSLLKHGRGRGTVVRTDREIDFFRDAEVIRPFAVEAGVESGEAEGIDRAGRSTRRIRRRHVDPVKGYTHCRIGTHSHAEDIVIQSIGRTDDEAVHLAAARADPTSRKSALDLARSSDASTQGGVLPHRREADSGEHRGSIHQDEGQKFRADLSTVNVSHGNFRGDPAGTAIDVTRIDALLDIPLRVTARAGCRVARAGVASCELTVTKTLQGGQPVTVGLKLGEWSALGRAILFVVARHRVGEGTGRAMVHRFDVAARGRNILHAAVNNGCLRRGRWWLSEASANRGVLCLRRH